MPMIIVTLPSLALIWKELHHFGKPGVHVTFITRRRATTLPTEQLYIRPNAETVKTCCALLKVLGATVEVGSQKAGLGPSYTYLGCAKLSWVHSNSVGFSEIRLDSLYEARLEPV